MSDSGSDIDDEPQYEVVFEDEAEKKDKFLRRDGKGTAKFSNGDTYVGSYANGKRNGVGKYTWSNGSTYEGEYLDNKKHGQGTYTAPDGGKYTGSWKDDKRDGNGSYYYPNGDTYIGEWYNGAKHGHGEYTYVSNSLSSSLLLSSLSVGGSSSSSLSSLSSLSSSSTLVGVWSNGECIHGEWRLHDGSKFIARFNANAPHGKGVFIHTNGQKQTGQFVLEKNNFNNNNGNSSNKKKAYTWMNQMFVPPLSSLSNQNHNNNSSGNKSIVVDPMTIAQRAVDKSVLKIDHFEAIYRLKKEIEGVPNFRSIISESGIFGCGQPTLNGYRSLFEHLSENFQLHKYVWINMRNEPLVYVNEYSYAPRDHKRLNENMEFNGLTIKDVEVLEKRLLDKTRLNVKRKGLQHEYYKDTFAENPVDRQNIQMNESVRDVVTDIKHVSAVYELLNEDEYDVVYHRLPIVDERAPLPQDFDRLVDILKNVDWSNTALIFNCQMGKGRTTTGTVVAVLMKKVVDESSGNTGSGGNGNRNNDNDDDNENEDGNGNGGNGKDPVVDGMNGNGGYDPYDANLKAGQYKMIMLLLSKLDNGEFIKQQVDDAIDKCKSMINLRECILYTKEMYDKESESRRDFWKRMGVNFVERYAYLLLFHAYLRANVDDDFAKPFSKWLQTQTAALDVLGTREEGPLSQFQWQ